MCRLKNRRDAQRHRRSVQRGADPEHVVNMRERYQLSHSYLLYVGNIKPHKNLERLIEAFPLIRKEGRSDSSSSSSATKFPSCSRCAARARIRYPRVSPLSRLRAADPRSQSSIVLLPSSYSRRCMKASVCRRSKPWRAARLSSRRTCRRCRRSSATRRCSWIRTRPIDRRRHPQRAQKHAPSRGVEQAGSRAREGVFVGALGAARA